MGRASFDVVVIGGGPAGSIAATSLALARRSVAVFEREKFPRFHIGESLLPFSMDAFERFGLLQKLDAAGFIRRCGAEITSGCGRRDPLYFKMASAPKLPRPFRWSAPSSTRSCWITHGNAELTCTKRPASRKSPSHRAAQD